MESIVSPCSLEEYSVRTAEEITNATESPISARRATRKPWTFEEALRMADTKYRLKQMKNTREKCAQAYKNSYKTVKRSARQ